MGMSDMFTTKANFTGILATKEQLIVSDVVHKAFIEINEVRAIWHLMPILVMRWIFFIIISEFFQNRKVLKLPLRLVSE